jgi:TrpR-related protein YerC/YecD
MAESKLKSKELDQLFRAIRSLNTEEEYYMFFEDLCTLSELDAIGQRYKVAGMLKDKMTTHAIAEQTGASTATISRVNKCLLHGAGGYQLALARMAEGDKKN